MNLQDLVPELKANESAIVLITAERKGKLATHGGIRFGPAWNIDQLNSYLARLSQIIREDAHPDEELLRRYLQLTYPEARNLPTNIRLPKTLIEEFQRERHIHDPNEITIFQKPMTKTITDREMREYATVFKLGGKSGVAGERGGKRGGTFMVAEHIPTGTPCLINSYKGVNAIVNLSNQDLNALIGGCMFFEKSKSQGKKHRQSLGLSQEL